MLDCVKGLCAPTVRTHNLREPTELSLLSLIEGTCAGLTVCGNSWCVEMWTLRDTVIWIVPFHAVYILS